MPAISKPDVIDLQTQLVSGPTLRDTAANTLRHALKTLYPNLDIDPQLAMVATPTWNIEGDHVAAGPDWFESLTDVLVRLGIYGSSVTWFDGEHFLTQQTGGGSALHLPVQIDAVGRLINELATLLFVAYQEQQVDYWNTATSPGQPRWYQLSDALRNVWNITDAKGWDAEQLAMAAAVYRFPDKQQRLPDDKLKIRACLIDIDRDDTTERTHLDVLPIAVLVGTSGQRTLIATHSITQGFRHFDSLDALGKALVKLLENNTQANHLQWRLFEPQGNFFDYQARTLIALDTDVIGSFGVSPSVGTSAVADEVTDLPTAVQPEEYFEQLRPLLPRWLDRASAADQACYSRHLLDLAVVQNRNKGKTFQREVSSLHAFTVEALTTRIRQDHPATAAIQVENIEITITSLVVWGTFVLPGQMDTLTLSLSELALQNLAGLPTGIKTVRHVDGTPIPGWLTADYLETLVTAVDIGRTYPAMLKRRLIDDPSEAPALRQLYAHQLPIELALLALQYKIRGEARLDERGYRYVVAAFATDASAREVDGQPIVIRPLAFMAHRSNDTVDTVANMFVIGPRQADKGPCLLYRPLLDPPLLQYPSRTNLLYAIKHSRTLKQAVLAWLPDSVRFNYSQYVFPATLPSVWIVPQLLVDPTIALDMTGAVTLADNNVIETDVLTTLFDANVQALITQADRQSVSNAEARWATLKRGSWMLFNAALPFLGRSIGTAAWIWQIMDDLQALIDARNEQPGAVDWSALTDLLLTLGTVLAHRAASSRQARRPTAITPPPKAIARTLTVTQLADVSGAEFPTAHETSLLTIGALSRSRPLLATLLDTLKVEKPEGLASPAIDGVHRHLYAHLRKWYAPVGERWFEVRLNDDEQVQIIDSRQQPVRNGPLLTHDAKGLWFIDLRLRLRGGGLGSRRKQMQQDNKQRLSQKKAEISAFDATLDARQAQLLNARQAMLSAQPAAVDGARDYFLQTLDSQLREYADHTEQLKALNALESVPSYRAAMVERLSHQLFLAQSWLDQRSKDFRDSLHATLKLLDEEASAPQPGRSAHFEKMADLTQGIIEKLQLAQSRLEELGLLGKEACEISRERKAKLPQFSLNDLKLLQITLAEQTCLKEETTQYVAQARNALDQLINDASVNIRSALDLSGDESWHNLSERTEAMDNLAQQFSTIDQRFSDLAIEYPQQIIGDRLEHIRVRVAEFSQDAVSELTRLLQERRLIEPTPGPSKPAAAPVKRIIKTRYKGTVVGESRQGADGQDTDLVDVKAPLTGKVIATFHQKTPGVWLRRVTASAGPKKTPATLADSLTNGQALLDGLADFKRRTQAHVSRAQRIPVDIQEIYNQHAARLGDVVKAIDKALLASNRTEERNDAATTLRDTLTSAASELYDTGRSTRIRMVKEQPPTAARVEWLKSKGEVDIARSTARRRLKGPGRDYLDEYEVLDHKTRKVLWYAHFHYANATDPAGSFTAAHLKTAAQRLLGGQVDRDSATQELIAIYRSEISRALAASLFFTPETATPSTSSHGTKS
ncbi:dermonecrotic toxin domain-containing protein [Pseudomonas sp. TWP3-1]|uniref:dermonecrotic toxin domain-containing protein n=1 Tax=Pseudomonas sp. TWP3-1 TaxID=2804631 RepID=UPI003CE713BE